jgi:hypothetical protein
MDGRRIDRIRLVPADAEAVAQREQQLTGREVRHG